MKKARKAQREFETIKKQLDQTAHIVSNTRDSKLWDHEASVRKRIRALHAMHYRDLKGFDEVLNGYLALLDDISKRLLNHYSKKKGMSYKFEEIVETDRDGYITSGIISVLVTSHIPKVMAEQFERCFPANPKNEYEPARKIKRRFILHLGETNTGKTYRAIERLKQARNGVYLAPLRILALENYERLNREGVPCHLITGEEELLTERAAHVSSTIEKLNLGKEYDVAVIDEIQMIGSSQRGQAWTRAVLGLRCPEIHVCGAFNARTLMEEILNDCGDDYEVIEYKRDTPLEVIGAIFSPDKVKKGDALVAFSKKRVLELSKFYQDKGIKNSVIYGDLPPEVRRMQYRAFIDGESTLLVTTDAIGMGVNLPIRRIVFMDLIKFDGEQKRYITSQEVKQIAGRAGRKGIYDIGYVGTARENPYFIRENLETEDDPIQRAVLGPGEAIVGIEGLPLRDKLALWSTTKEELGFYTKMDVRDYLLVLESLRPYKLPEEVQYRLMLLPFDVKDAEMMQCFLDYVYAFFVRQEPEIMRPSMTGSALFQYEKYYQKLGLYYSFAKNFGLKFDPDWVYKQREKTSEKINALLLKL